MVEAGFRKSQIALLIVLVCAIPAALWWGFRPDRPRPTLAVQFLGVTNLPSGTTAAILVVSNTCAANVRVFGPTYVEFRPPPLVPPGPSGPVVPVILAPQQAASFQVSPMPTQAWRTSFLYGYADVDERGMWRFLPSRVQRWLAANSVPVHGPSVATYCEVSDWVDR